MSKLKGETLFHVDGVPHTLVFSIEALICLEEHFAKGVAEIGALLQGELRASDLRVIFWAGLRDYHPELDLKAASRLMSQLGVPEASALISQAFVAAFATGAEAGDGAAKGPRKPAGTGRRSTASGPASADPTPTSGG